MHETLSMGDRGGDPRRAPASPDHHPSPTPRPPQCTAPATSTTRCRRTTAPTSRRRRRPSSARPRRRCGPTSSAGCASCSSRSARSRTGRRCARRARCSPTTPRSSAPSSRSPRPGRAPPSRCCARRAPTAALLDGDGDAAAADDGELELRQQPTLLVLQPSGRSLAHAPIQWVRARIDAAPPSASAAASSSSSSAVASAAAGTVGDGGDGGDAPAWCGVAGEVCVPVNRGLAAFEYLDVRGAGARAAQFGAIPRNYTGTPRKFGAILRNCCGTPRKSLRNSLRRPRSRPSTLSARTVPHLRTARRERKCSLRRVAGAVGPARRGASGGSGGGRRGRAHADGRRRRRRRRLAPRSEGGGSRTRGGGFDVGRRRRRRRRVGAPRRRRRRLLARRTSVEAREIRADARRRPRRPRRLRRRFPQRDESWRLLR